ncbi:hypothetical protein L195_g059965, partial [Trifolium pratense]
GGETPAEAVAVTTTAVAGSNRAVVDEETILTGSNNTLHGSGHNVLLGLLLHALIHLIGIGLMLTQNLNKMAFLAQSHLLPLLQLDQAQQILKLLSTLFILLSLTLLGTWTPEQHLI